MCHVHTTGLRVGGHLMLSETLNSDIHMLLNKTTPTPTAKFSHLCFGQKGPL
jgi:hypothetical protein